MTEKTTHSIMENTTYSMMASAVGDLVLLADDQGLCGLHFADCFLQADQPAIMENLRREDDHPILTQTRRQLEAYFAGQLQVFNLPLHLKEGSDFQKQVWQALAQIPYGQTMTYRQVAALVGRPKACRAVGQANHRNPISIILPCHRVIGADGGLTGYGGGLDRKRRLLELEIVGTGG